MLLVGSKTKIYVCDIFCIEHFSPSSHLKKISTFYLLPSLGNTKKSFIRWIL